MADYLEAQMEMLNTEAVIVDEVPSEMSAKVFDEMAELQLLLVGGGIGDTQL